jgi:hypothetical protein
VFALANTQGGALVAGVKDLKPEGSPPKDPRDFVGVPVEADLVHKVESQLIAAISPPVFTHVKTTTDTSVANEEGSLASSWRCPSLLKAVYLMLYLDEVASVRLLKCKAPNCTECFRVGPFSRDSLYCPPAPCKKQSKCASRASSAMYRERQRNRRDGDAT